VSPAGASLHANRGGVIEAALLHSHDLTSTRIRSDRKDGGTPAPAKHPLADAEGGHEEMAALPLSPLIARKSGASAERHGSQPHASILHYNAVFVPQPASHKPPPEREVGRSNRPGRAGGTPLLERDSGFGGFVG
jgi:hypothetical protein